MERESQRQATTTEKSLSLVPTSLDSANMGNLEKDLFPLRISDATQKHVVEKDGTVNLRSFRDRLEKASPRFYQHPKRLERW